MGLAVEGAAYIMLHAYLHSLERAYHSMQVTTKLMLVHHAPWHDDASTALIYGCNQASDGRCQGITACMHSM